MSKHTERTFFWGADVASMDDGSRPGTRSPSRRRVLRSVLAGSLATVVAGCNTDTASPTTAPGQTTDPATGSASPTPTATPLPPTSLSPTPVPTTEPTPTGTPTPSPTPTLSASAREFVAHLDAGAFETARAALSPQVASQLSAATLEQLWLGLTAQHGAYEAVADEEHSTANGYQVVVLTLRCAGGEQAVRFTFDDGTIAGLFFPGEYAPPAYADRSAFAERSVTVDAEGCALPGTLSVPDGAADDPVPGVVLVHGSGPNDRDSTIGPNKPLKDLAWGLASRGVAVLRYDKRTAACDVPLAEWTIDGIVVDDAVRALSVLADAEGVDPDRRFVVGHSLGAICTPRIAERAEGLAGGAMLAASARPITEVVRDQYRYLLSVDGELTAADEEQLASIDAAMTRVENGEVAPDERVQGLPGSWYASLLEYDQVATAQTVSLPLFVLQGGRDYQVPPDPEFERWRAALADRPETRFARYPDLSHLFQPGAEPSLGMEYNFPDNVAESVVVDLAAWVDSVTG